MLKKKKLFQQQLPENIAEIWRCYHWILLLIGGIKFPMQYNQSEALPKSGL